MLTITHRQGGRSVNIGYSAYDTQRYLYALGETKPHYPVPAPLIEIEFYPEHTAICNETTGYAYVLWEGETEIQRLEIAR